MAFPARLPVNVYVIVDPLWEHATAVHPGATWCGMWHAVLARVAPLGTLKLMVGFVSAPPLVFVNAMLPAVLAYVFVVTLTVQVPSASADSPVASARLLDAEHAPTWHAAPASPTNIPTPAHLPFMCPACPL